MTVVASQAGTLPDEKKAEDHDRNVCKDVAEKEDIEDAPRILAKDVDEVLERRIFFLQLPELMGLEREQRGFEPREKRGPEDQDRDGKEEKSKSRQRHFSLRRRGCNRSPSGKVKRARLPIIAGATKLRPS